MYEALLEEDPSASKGFLVIQKHVALRGSIPTGSGNSLQNGNHRSFPGVCVICVYNFIDIYDGACQLTRTHAVTLYNQCRGRLGIQKSVQNASPNHADVDPPQRCDMF